MLRRQFETAMAGRFKRLLAALVALVAVEDAFGLGRRRTTLGNAITNVRWAFKTQPEQLEELRKWLEALIASDILRSEAVGATAGETSWLAKYIEEAYNKGQGRAFDDTRRVWMGISTTERQLGFFEGSKSEFLRQSFSRPVSVERVKLLATRTFTDLKGVTDAMAQRISTTLVDGMIAGDSPREVARELAKTVNVSKNRALAIARTEIIRAHNEGALDALEALGVQKIGVMVEWVTAGDTKVCPLCRALEGIILKTKEAHGMFPRHPNCRCTPVPANVGESKRGQTRSATGLRAAIDRSIRAESRKGSLAERRRKSTWAGADKRISQTRPRSVV